MSNKHHEEVSFVAQSTVFNLSDPEKSVARKEDGTIIECQSPLGRDRLFATQEFIERSRFAIDMDVVVAFVKGEYTFPNGFRIEDIDGIGYSPEVSCTFMTWERGLAEDLWEDEYLERVKENPDEKLPNISLEHHVQNMLDYIVFATEQAMQGSSVSAVRSMIKLGTYLSCMGRAELTDIVIVPGKLSRCGRIEIVQLYKALGIEVPQDLRDAALEDELAREKRATIEQVDEGVSIAEQLMKILEAGRHGASEETIKAMLYTPDDNPGSLPN